MKQIGILLTHKHRLLSTAAILDVFETVNSFYKQDNKDQPFEINLFGNSNDHIAAEETFAGYTIYSIADAKKLDLIFIPAFSTNDMEQTLKKNMLFIPWLQQQYAAGTHIASYCTGAFLLGATGLLNGRPATTHIDACAQFAHAFPSVNLQPDRIVTGDKGLYTSGGATSGFHLMLFLIQHYCGKEMAVRTAKIFAIDMDREQQTYFATFVPSLNHSDELVAMAQQKIESAYQQAETIEEMIKDVPASRRNILRRFKMVTGNTPIEYLQKLRMENAKKLLEQTNQQLNEIIFNCGYNDPKAFRKIFKKSVGMTPTDYRKKFYISYS